MKTMTVRELRRELFEIDDQEAPVVIDLGVKRMTHGDLVLPEHPIKGDVVVKI